MHAVRRVHPGEVHLEEVRRDAPGEDEVIVDVLYAGVNPFDMQVLRGEIGDSSRPITLGAEATGRVGETLVQVSGGGLGVAWGRPATAPTRLR